MKFHLVQFKLIYNFFIADTVEEKFELYEKVFIKWEN